MSSGCGVRLRITECVERNSRGRDRWALSVGGVWQCLDFFPKKVALSWVLINLQCGWGRLGHAEHANSMSKGTEEWWSSNYVKAPQPWLCFKKIYMSEANSQKFWYNWSGERPACWQISPFSHIPLVGWQGSGLLLWGFGYTLILNVGWSMPGDAAGKEGRMGAMKVL